jgi:hypothetical protein
VCLLILLRVIHPPEVNHIPIVPYAERLRRSLTVWNAITPKRSEFVRRAGMRFSRPRIAVFEARKMKQCSGWKSRARN